MRQYALILAAAAVIAMVAQPGAAADNGFYLGASVGQSVIDIEDVSGDVADVDFSGDATGYKVFAGFRFLTFLAVEASYVDLGAPDDELAAISATAEADVTGFDAFAVGMLPLGIADIFVKAGMISWDADLAATAGGVTETFSDGGEDPAYGVGVQFRIRSFAIRGEVEYFDIDGAQNVYMYSVGGSYTF